MKCPTCYEGDLFVDSNSLHLKNLHLMHKKCKECGQDINPEPGFYTGAMYVSYAFAVGLFLFFFFVFEIKYPLSGIVFISSYALTLLVLAPFIFRYSRVIFLHLFYNYKPDAKAAFQSQNKNNSPI